MIRPSSGHAPRQLGARRPMDAGSGGSRDRHRFGGGGFDRLLRTNTPRTSEDTDPLRRCGGARHAMPLRRRGDGDRSTALPSGGSRGPTPFPEERLARDRFHATARRLSRHVAVVSFRGGVHHDDGRERWSVTAPSSEVTVLPEAPFGVVPGDQRARGLLFGGGHGYVGADPPPVASAVRRKPSCSARSKDTRAARCFGGRSLLGTAGIDSTELARDEPLLCFGRDAADHPSTTDRFGGHDSTVADRDGDGPFGARRCLLRSFGGAAEDRSSRRSGALRNGPRSGGSRGARAAPGGSTTSTMDDLPSWRGPCGRHRGSPRTALLGSVACVGGNPAAGSGFGRHTRGFGLGCHPRRSLLARDETVASTGTVASAAPLEGAIPQTDRRPMQNKPAYHIP